MKGFENKIIQNMACTLSRLINYNVNIFDVNGIIIGSSDETRIGTYHEYAHKLIKGKDELTKVYDETDHMKPGINLKIYSEDRVIGAVGITGDPDKAEIFSKIIKLSLESLIQQKVYEKKDRQVKKYEKQVVLDMIFKLSSTKDITKRLTVLDFKPKKHFVIVKLLRNSKAVEELFSKEPCLKAGMDDKTIFISSGDSRSKLLSFTDDVRATEADVIVSRIISMKMLSYEYRVINYIEQKVLCDNQHFYYTGDYSLEYFFNNIKKVKHVYVDMFNEAEKLVNEEVLLNTFNNYVENNLSAKKTAEAMYVHPNTLKYRLKRIESLTHCNLKNVNDIIKLKISILSLKDKK